MNFIILSYTKQTIMKKTVTLCFIAFSLSSLFAQQQIGNSNMEDWDNIGASTEEPTNWNGFKTASGGLSSFASQQVFRSTAIRSGASGMYCARIFSKSVFGVVANGNLTLGKINMGSTTVTDPANHNASITNDANFSETLTSLPDSIVFWAKFTAAQQNQQARIHAIIHDAFDVHDPIDAASSSHVLATAGLSYSPNVNWVRYSVPFESYAFTGTPPTPQYILVTFATNVIPGGGAANDEVLVDDIQLIYNSTIGVDELSTTFFTYYSTENGLTISGNEPLYEVFNLSGQQLKFGSATELNGLKLNSGIYIVKSSSRSEKVLVP
jgi:hypothetical protein